MKVKIKIVNTSNHPLPTYQTSHSAGLDLYAFLEGARVIKPLERALIPTGLFIELPEGFEAQVRPRSGLAIKHGITVLNSPGTIDADYRGEIKVILINLSDSDFILQNGDRIAQMIISTYAEAEWVETRFLSGTSRESGGFGSTGR
jgi:dUTP pyrophosphatase